jgi:alcohol dehydrogenase class IV
MYSLERIPHTIVGRGSATKLDQFIEEGLGNLCSGIILATGRASFDQSAYGKEILHTLKRLEKPIFRVSFGREPSPEDIDAQVERIRKESGEHHPNFSLVAIGGGSVIDGAKALAAGVLQEKPLIHYLEGVGDTPLQGRRLPLIVLPTTSGTGSEATKNSVLTRTGADGFKKSMRHSILIPDMVVIDPELTLSLPPSITIPAGLDALTQLLEAFVSTKAHRLTDSYAARGLALAATAFPGVCEEPGNLEYREQMGLAAYFSGIALANAGLGFVHGAASPLGAAHPVPHGLICGLLLLPAVKATVETLVREDNRQGLERYAMAGLLLSGNVRSFEEGIKACSDTKGLDRGIEQLLETLSSWQKRYPLEPLSRFGFTGKEVKALAPSCGFKNAPASFSLEKVEEILLSVL